MQNSREYFEPASVVRSMKFNSDGKTLFCGLHESLKVLSWEPIICHDVVDVGWSTLADLTVDEGKLIGCSYNQNCVGVWVVDLMKHEPYADSCAESHLNVSVDRLVESDNSISSVFGRLSVSKSPANETGMDTLLRSMSASKEIPVSASSVIRKRLAKPPGEKDIRLTRSDSAPLLSPRVRLNPNFVGGQKRQPATVVPPAPMYKSMSRISRYGGKESSFIPVLAPNSQGNVDPILSEAAIGELRVIEPQNIEKVGLSANHGKESGKLVPMNDSRRPRMVDEGGCRRITDDVGYKKIISEIHLRANPDIDYTRRAQESPNDREHIFLSKPISSQRKFMRESSGAGDNSCSGSECTEKIESSAGCFYGMSCFDTWNSDAAWNPEFANGNRNEVIGTSKWKESGERHAVGHRPCSSHYDNIQCEPTLYGLRLHSSLPGKLVASASDEDGRYGLMENHQDFIHVMKSRLTKLEVVYRCWQRNDIKGSIDATWRILDFAVTADVISALKENSNCISLNICASILRISYSLLESNYDRHVNVALGMILSLVKSFGSTISSALSATPLVGVDLEAEQRLERCSLCFQELKKVNASLKSLTRRQGEVGRSAQELSLFLQDILQL